jgi:hypothetical protein
MKTATALPDVSTWPHTICRICGGSKINGLFTPAELGEQATYFGHLLCACGKSMMYEVPVEVVG